MSGASCHVAALQNSKEMHDSSFGNARLRRPDVGALERTYFKLFGLADPGHYIRSKYFRAFTRGLVPTSVLDVGCGAGDYSFYLAQEFPQSQVFGFDGNASIIERNRMTAEKMQLTNLEFATKDLCAISAEGEYDLILCVESLQYVQRPGEVIQRCAQALKSGGHIFIHMPVRRSRPVPLQQFLADFHGDEVVASHSAAEILALVREAGLKVERSKATFSYYTGELACSLFCMFYERTLLNQIMQGLVSPLGRVLAALELRGISADGFAVAILARKG